MSHNLHFRDRITAGTIILSNDNVQVPPMPRKPIEPSTPPIEKPVGKITAINIGHGPAYHSSDDSHVGTFTIQVLTTPPEVHDRDKGDKDVLKALEARFIREGITPCGAPAAWHTHDPMLSGGIMNLPLAHRERATAIIGSILEENKKIRTTGNAL